MLFPGNTSLLRLIHFHHKRMNTPQVARPG
jgi:hypothetical protein